MGKCRTTLTTVRCFLDSLWSTV